MIGKDDPKEWTISVLIYLEAKYPGGGSGALSKKKAQVPLRLKGRCKRIVDQWANDSGADLVPTDIRDPAGSQVLAS